MRKRTFGALLALCLCIAVTAAAPVCMAGDDGADKKESSGKTSKPRVITNADLEKYSKGGKARKVVKAAPAPPLPVDQEGAAKPPRISLPPEDRLDGASLPELEERQRELQEFLTYLNAKAAWLKNPFLAAAQPSGGQVLLDDKLSGAEELRLTESRIFAVEGRLGKIRLLIQSGGSRAPALEP